MANLRNHWELDPAIIMPDGVIVMAATRADAERIVWEMNRLCLSPSYS